MIFMCEAARLFSALPGKLIRDKKMEDKKMKLRVPWPAIKCAVSLHLILFPGALTNRNEEGMLSVCHPHFDCQSKQLCGYGRV
ncbi:MAG: hypothetical protein CMO80_11170 [Verrucomicrobiales bacterium]|nr:hypothetical protein [Verrucomicrobiales bacterium]|tara:strand:+ start:372 stop:620 length:249 start_codon:yes stop_codon:yes gene_type:complete